MVNQSGIDMYSTHRENLARRFAAKPPEEVHPALFEYAERASEEGKTLRILDIGSGSGHEAHELAKLGHQVVGIEPSALRDIAIRDNSHPHVEYRDGRLPELHSVGNDEKFDIVILNLVLQIIDPAERAASLKRVAETLAPQGKLLITYPSPPSREHHFEVTPEMLEQDIAAANQHLPKGKKLSLSGEPIITPDSTGRKTLEGGQLNFYSYTLTAGHAQSLGPRTGRVLS